MKPLYIYLATVTNVVDGDTFDAEVDLGFEVFTKKRFRLVNIDTPETWRPKSPQEKIRGELAKAFTTEKLLGKKVLIRSVASHASIYARWEAEVYLTEDDYKNGVTLSAMLSTAGFDKKTPEEYLKPQE